MAECVTIPVESGDLNAALERFFGGLLEKGIVRGVFAPMRQPGGKVVMPTLATKPENLKGLDLFAPVAPVSGARALSAVTAKESPFRIAAFLRPCDLRAYVELIKLKQAYAEQVLTVSMDCMGRMESADFLSLAEKHGRRAGQVFQKARGKLEGFPLLRACRACEHPAHPGADIGIRLLAADLEKELILCGQTEKGIKVLDDLGYERAEEPAGREKELQELIRERTAERDAMFEEFRNKAVSFAALREVMSVCINCYNCRAACPVCYCKECVFLTDTFRHDPEQYFQWAEKKGVVKVPTDTLFFHLTRMLHISALCVGCGQCSAACPMGLPVMEIFRAAAANAQRCFQYEPGRSPDDPLPLSVFEDQEFLELAGK